MGPDHNIKLSSKVNLIRSGPHFQTRLFWFPKENRWHETKKQRAENDLAFLQLNSLE
jgi:hypothetical protein